MTPDQLTPGDAADGAPLLDGGGWGMGMGVLSDGTYGWAGGLGTFWRTNPSRDRIAVLLTPELQAFRTDQDRRKRSNPDTDPGTARRT